MTKRKKWGILLLVGPTLLLIFNALLQFVVRFVFASVEGGSGPVVLVVNILSLLIGVVAVVALIPGIIVGIIFLATPDKKDNSPTPPTAGSPTA